MLIVKDELHKNLKQYWTVVIARNILCSVDASKNWYTLGQFSHNLVHSAFDL